MATFRARRPWRFLIPGVLLFYLAYSLLHRRPSEAHAVHTAKTKSFFPPLETRAANAIELDYCQNFPKDLLGHVQVVLKVASGETAVNKAHLNTVSSCIDNLIIVGDREEQLGDRSVIDILADLPKSYETNNVDFQAYVKHHKAHIEGETVHESQRSFKLDRFKYLPMVDRAYTTNPKAKWFVFLESDVYFFWDTLFRLLSQYDPAVPHYFGAPHKGSNGRWFAYGGAGFVMSQGLMKQLIPAKTPSGTDIPRESRLGVRFENWVKEEARGDAVLAYAIQNVTGSKLEALDPTFTSERLDKIVTNRDRWCVPLLSLHQLSPDQMGELWKWERTRQYNLVSHTTMSCPCVKSSTNTPIATLHILVPPLLHPLVPRLELVARMVEQPVRGSCAQRPPSPSQCRLVRLRVRQGQQLPAVVLFADRLPLRKLHPIGYQRRP
jgi:hypothetical protein